MKGYIPCGVVLAVLAAGVVGAQTPGPDGAGANANRGGGGFFGPGPNAPPPEFAELRAVPHGEIRTVWYDSKALGVQRRLTVYVPPGYESGRGSYPVLYLIHGGGQDDAAWTGGGRAQFVLDNLLAAGAAKPMIVVMPNGGSADPTLNLPSQDSTPNGLITRTAASSRVRDDFLRDLLDGVIPLVETRFRAQRDRESRAIAGFSFGGAESLQAGTAHFDRFAWVGMFSMGIQGGSHAGAGAIAGSGSAAAPDAFVKEHAAFFADPAKTNKMMKLIWIGVGRSDGIVSDGPKQLAETLAAQGIHREFREYDGGHSMSNPNLRDFAALLFRGH